MDRRHRILVVCSDASCAGALTAIMSGWALGATVASTLAEARQALRQSTPSLVISEDRLSDGGFQDVLELLRGTRPLVRVLVLLRDSSQYSEALQLGAFGAIPMPFQRADAQWALIQALRNGPGAHLGSAAGNAPRTASSSSGKQGENGTSVSRTPVGETAGR